MRGQTLDPRYYQLTAQFIFLMAGSYLLHFDIIDKAILLTFATCVIVQIIASLIAKLKINILSALITAASISLLLKSNYLSVYVLTSAIAIASKFIFRINQKHIFNPANFGLVVILSFTNLAWLSPNQWGQFLWLIVIFIFLGLLINKKSNTIELALSFLISYTFLIFLRGYWLGDPLNLTIHKIENGALMLFAFFMISDPKTTPNARSARIIYACLLSSLTLYLKIFYFVNYDLIYSLFILSPLVPILDYLIPGKKFEWDRHQSLRRKQYV